MIIDKNGKIGGKISIIDVFAIIVALIFVFGILYRFHSAPSKSARENVKLQYVVKVYGVREYSVDAISKMGIVIDPEQKCKMGEIVDVSYIPEIWEQFDVDGNIVYAEVPNKYDVEVTILSDGRETENGYYVGNETKLSVGSTINLVTKYANSSGTVKSIKKL